jgi:hypothetical protein
VTKKRRYYDGSDKKGKKKNADELCLQQSWALLRSSPGREDKAINDRIRKTGMGKRQRKRRGKRQRNKEKITQVTTGWFMGTCFRESSVVVRSGRGLLVQKQEKAIQTDLLSVGRWFLGATSEFLGLNILRDGRQLDGECCLAIDNPRRHLFLGNPEGDAMLCAQSLILAKLEQDVRPCWSVCGLVVTETGVEGRDSSVTMVLDLKLHCGVCTSSHSPKTLKKQHLIVKKNGVRGLKVLDVAKGVLIIENVGNGGPVPADFDVLDRVSREERSAKTCSGLLGGEEVSKCVQMIEVEFWLGRPQDILDLFRHLFTHQENRSTT